MSPFRARGERMWRIYIPTRPGGWAIRSSGTRHKATADAMSRMVKALGRRGTRDWEILEAVLSGHRSIGQLYDAVRANQLERFRAELQDLDLQTYVGRWQAWLTGRVKQETIDRYATHLATLHQGNPWPRSTLTAERIEAWLSHLAVSGSTKRKYHAALASFLTYGRSLKILVDNPLATVTAPPSARHRIQFLELEDVRRVVGASSAPYKGLFALLYGTAIDLSTALQLRRRDVNLETREIRAAGTKTATRDRLCLVTEWAWAYVEPVCQDKLPDAELFPYVSRWTASDMHRGLLVALRLREAGKGIRGLRLQDARHHWAVMHARAGVPIEVISRQLGHVDGTLCLRIYGKFIPRTEDRKRWDRVVTKYEQTGEL